jgi:hypothetical protein
MKKILLLVEGEKLEVNLLNKLLAIYSLDVNYEIYPYKTNIYELYERMFKGNEEDLDVLDLLGILKERDHDSKILNEDYSDIILVFDYEPQDNRFSEERINLMLSYFNESTDNGKLYINYPMAESFKHIKSIPDSDYKERAVDFSVLSSGKYKELVSKESKFTDINIYSKQIFNSIIIHNIRKAYYITKSEYDIEDIKAGYYELEPIEILKKQNYVLINSKQIYVLNTCLFYICDYNIKLILDS